MLLNSLRPVHAVRWFSSTTTLQGFVFLHPPSRLHRASNAKFDYRDPLNLDSCLTDEEREIRSSVRKFCESELLPGITLAYRNESTQLITCT